MQISFVYFLVASRFSLFDLWGVPFSLPAEIGDSSINIPPLASATSSHVMANMSNKFSLLNSFWFAFSSLMQQANYASPMSMSGRIVSAVWWFFTFILISSYTANFAALLTIERMTTPINSVEELAAQRSIQFGTLQGSSTMEFFKVNIFRPSRSHQDKTYLFSLRVNVYFVLATVLFLLLFFFVSCFFFVNVCNEFNIC